MAQEKRRWRVSAPSELSLYKRCAISPTTWRSLRDRHSDDATAAQHYNILPVPARAYRDRCLTPARRNLCATRACVWHGRGQQGSAEMKKTPYGSHDKPIRLRAAPGNGLDKYHKRTIKTRLSQDITPTACLGVGSIPRALETAGVAELNTHRGVRAHKRIPCIEHATKLARQAHNAGHKTASGWRNLPRASRAGLYHGGMEAETHVHKHECA